MQDQQITGFNTDRWYEHLLRESNSTSTDLDKFVRYFRISGMNHCNAGPGAWWIGQGATDIPFEPRVNVLAAIVDWVENGNAPETIEGTKFNNDLSTAGVAFRRRHCRLVACQTH
jgi:feruloyl esterase